MKIVYRRYSWNQLRRTESDRNRGNERIRNSGNLTLSVIGNLVSQGIFSLYNSNRQCKGNEFIYFPFEFVRTTLFPQPLGCSRSSRCLVLHMLFPGSDLLLHFDITPDVTKSKIPRQFLFRSCRHTRRYPHTGPRVRCWYNITGIGSVCDAASKFLLWCEPFSVDIANFF